MIRRAPRSTLFLCASLCVSCRRGGGGRILGSQVGAVELELNAGDSHVIGSSGRDRDCGGNGGAAGWTGYRDCGRRGVRWRGGGVFEPLGGPPSRVGRCTIGLRGEIGSASCRGR